MALNIFSTLAKKKYAPMSSMSRQSAYSSPNKNTGNTTGNVGQNMSIYKPSAQSNTVAAARKQAYAKLKKNPNSQVHYSVPAQTGSQGRYSISSTPKPTPQQPSQVNYSQLQQQPQQSNSMENYLNSSQARAEALAKQQADEQQRIAEETYNQEASALQAQQDNLQGQLGQYRARTQEDLANQQKAADQSKANAKEEWGAAQRRLAQTRMQQKSALEKQYASLGTVDSYGTGSFTGANANVENDFTRMTNETQNNMLNRLAEIDNNFLNAKTEATRRMQDEESKYNQAVQQINQQLAGNAQLKGQALRQAAMTLQQRRAEIYDQIEGLKMQAEQDKYETQQKLALQAQQDAQFQDEFSKLSQQFISTGKPQTMDDVIFINKNKDTYKEIIGSMSGQSNNGAGKVAAKDANIARQGMETIMNIKDNLGARQDINPLSNRSYKTSITNLSDMIGRLRSGGAINSEEEKRFKSLLPTYFDDEVTAQNKIQSIYNEFSSLLGVEGSNLYGESDNPAGI